MVSRILRRSGKAVSSIVELLNWRADHIYQVGMGQFHQEMELLKEEWPDVQITGFEAHPDIVKAREKHYPGTLYSIAVTDKIGPVTIYCKKRHKDGTSLFPFIQKGDEDYKTMEVFANTLDNLIPEGPEGERVLLWLDCEGSELNVLKGGEKFCRKVQVINVEITSKPPGIGWSDPGRVHRWMIEHGFLRQWIHTQRTGAGQYDATYVRRELFDSRFCCDPYPI